MNEEFDRPDFDDGEDDEDDSDDNDYIPDPDFDEDVERGR